MLNTQARELARTQTFILAGGQGERLQPLTTLRPKPAVSFGGMFRIIDFTLYNCLHSGLSAVSLLTQYRHEELHRHIRESWWDLWNGSSTEREPLRCLQPVTGKRYRGTADAVFQNAELLSENSEFVLVLSGDHIYQMDYRDLLRRHVETNADLTIATVEYPLDEASHFGVVEVDRSLRVTGFEEKPTNPRPLPGNSSRALVSMGVYVFKKSVLLASLRAVCESGTGYDFGHHIIPTLIHSTRSYAYDFRDEKENAPAYWRDIGTIDAYYAASMDLVRENPPFDPSPIGHPAPRHRLRAHVHLDSRVAQSVLSPCVRIEGGVEIERAILLPGVRVGKGARIRRAIVEEGLELPEGFSVGFDGEQDRKQHSVTNSGIVVISHTPGKTKPIDLPLVFTNARARTANSVHGDAVRATA
jgi:glucose-1-phosphate adenylyltransferase